MSRLPSQTIILFSAIITLFFLWDFSQRVITSMQLLQLEKAYEQWVADEEKRNALLRTRQAYVQSDDFVIDYTRRNWRWAFPNDTVVIPQITPAPTPIPTPPAPTPIPTKTFQQQLFDLLFGP